MTKAVQYVGCTSIFILLNYYIQLIWDLRGMEDPQGNGTIRM